MCRAVLCLQASGKTNLCRGLMEGIRLLHVAAKKDRAEALIGQQQHHQQQPPPPPPDAPPNAEDRPQPAASSARMAAEASSRTAVASAAAAAAGGGGGGGARNRAVLLFTDGKATHGITDTATLVAEVRHQMMDGAQDVNIFTFGYGSEHFPTKLHALASTTSGLYYFI